MEVIDERGYLFGVVNVIDALVVLLVLAVGVAGVALVTGSEAGDETETEVVILRTDTYPAFVTDAIPDGPVAAGDIVAVHEKVVTQDGGGDSQSGDPPTRAQLRVELQTHSGTDGLPTFQGERLFVGRQLRLDFGETIVEGVVVDFAG